MKNAYLYCFVTASLLACGLSGCGNGDVIGGCNERCDPQQARRCTSEGVEICESDENGCAIYRTDPCQPGLHCDDNTLECVSGSVSCDETCNPNALNRCTANGVETCASDTDGCAVWELTEECAPGLHCDDNTLECVSGLDSCEETCNPNALNRCTANGVETCSSDADGCAVWELTEECAPGLHCDDATLECVSGPVPCEETCNPDALKRCTPDGVESCSPDSNGCAVWELTETCTGKQICDETALRCIGECASVCTKDDKRCTAKGVEVCQDANADGCVEWNLVMPCKEGQVCDEGSLSCACNNFCTKGDTKCENNHLYECIENASGCLNWKDKESCSVGKKCNSAKKACEYLCGNDCNPFSIILIPDTQYYSANYQYETGDKNRYSRQMKWIKDNEKKENIRAVIHLGDITETNCEGNWKIADYAHKNYLDKTSIPYAISTGNHDYEWNTSQCDPLATGYSRGVTQFSKYFGPNRFKGKSWYHASPYDANSYITFSVGNIKFLVLALEYSPRQEVLCWANDLIKKYPDHHVIVDTHSYLGENPGKTTSDSVFGQHGYVEVDDWKRAENGASGYDIYHGLVARHSNVFMAVCGHVGEDEWRQKKAYNNNTVTEMIVDYQYEYPCDSANPSDCTAKCEAAYKAGNGWMRQLIFDPKTNKVQAKTFTILNDNEFAGGKPAFYCSVYSSDMNASDHQFSFSSDFTTPVKYQYSENNYIGFAIQTINANDNGEQLNPAIAMHRTTGSVVAVWEDNSSDKDGNATAGHKKDQPNHDIAARIFYGGGCQKVAQFTVNTNTSGDQMTPDVAMDKNGNFVVVWADDADGNGYYDVMMRGFDENGKERIKTTVVHTSDDKQQRNPAIAMAPDGRFVVAWEDESASEGKPQVYIRGFDANGKPTFADRNVVSPAGVRQKPDIAIADNGTFVVTWEDDGDDNHYFEILAKGFNANGTDRIPYIVVNTKSGGQQRNPSIAMNGAGVFYVAYEDDEDENSIYRIKAHGYQADGKELTADMWITDAGDDAVEPGLCVNSKNEVVYTWTARALNSGDIRRRAYRNGKLEANHNVHFNKSNDDGTAIQNQPAIGCTDDGKSAILWHDDLDGNGYYDIFGRGFNEM